MTQEFGEQIIFTEEDVAGPDMLATQDTGLRCGELIDEMFALQADVDHMEKVIADKNARIKDISEQLLPSLMASMNVSEWKTMAGNKVALTDVVQASLNKKGDGPILHENLVSWLDEQGYDAIAKREVTVLFGAKNQSEAKELYAELETRKVPVHMAIDIHHSTLSATLREISRNGGALPDPAKTGINLRHATVAKITRK